MKLTNEKLNHLLEQISRIIRNTNSIVAEELLEAKFKDRIKVALSCAKDVEEKLKHLETSEDVETKVKQIVKFKTFASTEEFEDWQEELGDTTGLHQLVPMITNSTSRKTGDYENVTHNYGLMATYVLKED